MQCFVTYHTGRFLQLPMTSSRCLWLLIALLVLYNPGFKDRKGAQEAFSPRPRARRYAMVVRDATLAGDGSVELKNIQGTLEEMYVLSESLRAKKDRRVGAKTVRSDRQ